MSLLHREHEEIALLAGELAEIVDRSTPPDETRALLALVRRRTEIEEERLYPLLNPPIATEPQARQRHYG